MIIEIVGALIRDAGGRLLTVRKHGSAIFMLPGGKPEPDEAPAEALARELAEELGLDVVSAEPFGIFEASAANEPGARVRSTVFVVQAQGTAACAAEIAEMLWLDLAAPPPVPLAPLLVSQVLPRLQVVK